MEWIEVRARTVEEAKERALDALGVHESELEVEIVAAPGRALFGLRRTEAHIRARVKPLSREKPQDKRRRRAREEGRTRKPREGSGAPTGGAPRRGASPPAGAARKPAATDAEDGGAGGGAREGTAR